MSNPTVPTPEEVASVFEAIAEVLTPYVRQLTISIKELVDNVNAQGGYFTDDGREVGYFEHLEYQKWKVHDEIAQLRAELVEE